MYLDTIATPLLSPRLSTHSHSYALFSLKQGKGKGKDCPTKNLADVLDPTTQPLFAVDAPNALDPSFIFEPEPHTDDVYVVEICKEEHHDAGLIDPGTHHPLYTPIYGYGDGHTCTWPGKSFEVTSFENIYVQWENKLPIEDYLITSLKGESVLDTSLHWAYSLPGYEHYTIEHDGVPIVVHLHGGHTDFEWDGGPEFFYSPDAVIKGPEFVGTNYTYDNSQEATTSWYHGKGQLNYALSLYRKLFHLTNCRLTIEQITLSESLVSMSLLVWLDSISFAMS